MQQDHDEQEHDEKGGRLKKGGKIITTK